MKNLKKQILIDNYLFVYQGIKISNPHMDEMLSSKVNPFDYYGDVYLEYLRKKCTKWNKNCHNEDTIDWIEFLEEQKALLKR